MYVKTGEVDNYFELAQVMVANHVIAKFIKRLDEVLRLQLLEQKPSIKIGWQKFALSLYTGPLVVSINIIANINIMPV